MANTFQKDDSGKIISFKDAVLSRQKENQNKSSATDDAIVTLSKSGEKQLEAIETANTQQLDYNTESLRVLTTIKESLVEMSKKIELVTTGSLISAKDRSKESIDSFIKEEDKQEQQFVIIDVFTKSVEDLKQSNVNSFNKLYDTIKDSTEKMVAAITANSGGDDSTMMGAIGARGKPSGKKGGSLRKGMGRSIVGGVGTAASALAMISAPWLVDAAAGALGLGDKNIDKEQDEANWKRASLWEKIQSAPARGVEKIGGLFGGNLKNEAMARRIKEETEYLDKKYGKRVEDATDNTKSDDKLSGFIPDKKEVDSRVQEKLKDHPLRDSIDVQRDAREEVILQMKNEAARSTNKTSGEQTESEKNLNEFIEGKIDAEEYNKRLKTLVERGEPISRTVETKVSNITTKPSRVATPAPVIESEPISSPEEMSTPQLTGVGYAQASTPTPVVTPVIEPISSPEEMSTPQLTGVGYAQTSSPGFFSRIGKRIKESLNNRNTKISENALDEKRSISKLGTTSLEDYKTERAELQLSTKEMGDIIHSKSIAAEDAKENAAKSSGTAIVNAPTTVNNNTSQQSIMRSPVRNEDPTLARYLAA